MVFFLFIVFVEDRALGLEGKRGRGRSGLHGEEKEKVKKVRKKEKGRRLTPFSFCLFNGCRKPSRMSFKDLQHFTS